MKESLVVKARIKEVVGSMNVAGDLAAALDERYDLSYVFLVPEMVDRVTNAGAQSVSVVCGSQLGNRPLGA